MKTTRFVFLVALSAVVARGASFGIPSGQVQEQTTRQGKLKKADPGKDQISSSTGAKKVRPHPPVVSPAKSPAGRMSRPAGMGLNKTYPQSAPAYTMDFHQGGSPSAGAQAKKLNSRGSSPATTSVAGINGHGIKNSRDPGARIAYAGGPANPTRNAGALNGSEMKRKP